MENFNKEIKEGLVLVDFFATWCGPCKMLDPVIEELESENMVKIVKIDIDDSMDIAREYSVMSVPTLILFKDSKLVEREVGFKTIYDLKKMVNKHK